MLQVDTTKQNLCVFFSCRFVSFAALRETHDAGARADGYAPPLPLPPGPAGSPPSRPACLQGAMAEQWRSNGTDRGEIGAQLATALLVAWFWGGGVGVGSCLVGAKERPNDEDQDQEQEQHLRHRETRATVIETCMWFTSMSWHMVHTCAVVRAFSQPPPPCFGSSQTWSQEWVAAKGG